MKISRRIECAELDGLSEPKAAAAAPPSPPSDTECLYVCPSCSGIIDEQTFMADLIPTCSHCHTASHWQAWEEIDAVTKAPLTVEALFRDID